MDEREVRDLLANAAETVAPSPELPARAEQRYRRRRTRAQAAAAAVVAVVVGCGIGAAALIAANRTTAPARPTPEPKPHISSAVDVKSFVSLAFVDATIGYGLSSADGRAVLAKTEDGARSWREVSPVRSGSLGVALAPHSTDRSAGVFVWGPSGLSETSDDGASWRTALTGNVADVVSAANRIWATMSCTRSEPCTNKLMTSDDDGFTWLQVAIKAADVGAVAVSKSPVAVVAELISRTSKQWEIAETKPGIERIDGPTPCPASAVPRLAVGGDGSSLMLVCSVDTRDLVFVSADLGHSWTETVSLPPGGRVRALSSWDGSDATFEVGLSSVVGPGWEKGPLRYPVLGQWAWKARPQPIGAVRAFGLIPGGGSYFAAATGVWFDDGNVRELRTIQASSSGTANIPSTAIDLFGLNNMSFVDANVGFGVVQDADPKSGTISKTGVIRTDDGGRTWHRVGEIDHADDALHFENEFDGIAWGDGPLDVTTDGGEHWTSPSGTRPVPGSFASRVSWSGGRLWALSQCTSTSASAANPALTSDDNGRTWLPADPFAPGFSGTTILATTRDTAYVVGPVNVNASQPGPWQIQMTSDGGASWTPEPVPCATFTTSVSLAFNGRVLLLACVGEPAGTTTMMQEWASTNGGRSWQAGGKIGGGDALLSNVGPTFLDVDGRGSVLSSTDDGATWQTAIESDDGAVVDVLPGVGAWIAIERTVSNNGIWFSGDGVHWEQRLSLTSAGTPSPSSAPVDVSRITQVSFVDANIGYGLVSDTADATSTVVRSDDGGRTWRPVGALVETEAGINFENAADGVAWGNGPLEVTTDGGAHWTLSNGPVDNVLTSSNGRLWALTPCVQSTPCGSRPVLTSDNAGRTWQPSAPLRQGLGGASIDAVSKTTAYIAEPATDAQNGPSQVAVTTNGGVSWTYAPTPCGSQSGNLAYNGQALLLICTQGQTAAQQFEVYSSTNEANTWQSLGANPFVGGYLETLTNVGSTFVVAMQRGDIWSSPDGKSWHQETNVGEGFWSISTVPGVGAWAATGPADQHAGILSSADGIHWQQQTGGS